MAFSSPAIGFAVAGTDPAISDAAFATGVAGRESVPSGSTAFQSLRSFALAASRAVCSAVRSASPCASGVAPLPIPKPLSVRFDALARLPRYERRPVPRLALESIRCASAACPAPLASPPLPWHLPRPGWPPSARGPGCPRLLASPWVGFPGALTYALHFAVPTGPERIGLRQLRLGLVANSRSSATRPYRRLADRSLALNREQFSPKPRRDSPHPRFPEAQRLPVAGS